MSSAELQPERPSPLFKRVTAVVGGNIISFAEFKKQSRNSKKLVKALLDRIDELNKAARIDIKTGLPNDDDCRETILNMIRARPAPTPDDKRQPFHYPLPTVALIDINGLGELNDKYSYNAGDKAIEHIANVLKKYHGKILRSTDYVARAGQHSDEFTIILREISPDNAKPIMEALVKEIGKKPIKYKDSFGVEFDIPVTACYGMSQMRYGDTIDALRERVSISLQDAKDTHYGRPPRDRTKKTFAERVENRSSITTLMGSDPKDLPVTDSETGKHAKDVVRREKRAKEDGKEGDAVGGA